MWGQEAEVAEGLGVAGRIFNHGWTRIHTDFGVEFLQEQTKETEKTKGFTRITRIDTNSLTAETAKTARGDTD